MTCSAPMGETEAPLQNSGETVSVLLIAIDASSEASRVISTGTRLARSAPEATVHLAHVFKASRLDRARAGAPVQSGEALEEAKEYLESQVRAARRQCRNPVVSHLPVGDPNSEVIRLAEELRADMLVVGTHDHMGFERLLLGSIAESLVRKAPCSVMVVRRPHHTR